MGVFRLWIWTSRVRIPSLTPSFNHLRGLRCNSRLQLGSIWQLPEEHWSDRAAKISFWSLNLGLVWMVFATLLPLGILQLYHSVSIGYFDARSLKFLTGGANPVLEWLRLPGDVVFIVGGTLPLVYQCWLGVRYGMGRPVEEEPTQVLFTEFIESRAS